MADPRMAKVRYYLDESISLDSRVMLHEMLGEAQAAMCDINDDSITHIISLTMNMKLPPSLERDVRDGKVYVCTPGWVHRSMLLSHQNPAGFSPDPAMIFSGICVYCSTDLPPGDRDVICGVVEGLGGQYRPAPTREVTHIICLQPNERAFKDIEAAGIGIKHVLPHWIEQCFKLGRPVPPLPFQFTTFDKPPIAWQATTLIDDKAAYQKTMSDIIKKAQAAEDAKSEEGKERTDLFKTTAEGYIPQLNSVVAEVFDGKCFMLSDSLELDVVGKATLEALIEKAGGTVDGDYDILITRHRTGHDYLQAARLGKTIGTIEWIHYVVKIKRLSSPLDMLLHYPTPIEKIDGFEKLSMSITNYTGGARDYLKRLITEMGAECTTTMSKDTTHLIAASKLGEKAARADEWNITTLNHLYLEECFRAWTMLAPTAMNSMFINFEPENNYMAMIGHTALLPESLAKWTNVPVLSAGSQAQLHGDVQMEDPSTGREASHLTVQPSALPGPSSSTTPKPLTAKTPKSAKGQVLMTTSANGATPSKRQRLESAEPGAHLRTPQNRGMQLDNILSVGSKRRAAEAAAEKVHESALDANKFAKEKNRKHLISPQSRRAARLPLNTPAKDTSDLSDEEQEELAPPRKTRKTAVGRRVSTVHIVKEEGGKVADLPPKTVVLGARAVAAMSVSVEPEQRGSLLGDRKPRWVATGLTLQDGHIKAMNKLGARAAPKVDQCTHLVCKSITRTPKFLQALPAAPIIVSADWVEACCKAKAIIDETPFLLNDPAVEVKYGFSLKESLERAKDLKESGGLLNGMHFFVTERGEPDFGMLQSVARAAGGNLSRYQTAKEGFLLDEDEQSFLISSEEDKAVWAPLKAKGIPIYTRELILTGVLKMQLDMDNNQL